MAEIKKVTKIDWNKTLQSMEVEEVIESNGLKNLNAARRAANYLKGLGVGAWISSVPNVNGAKFNITRKS